MENNAQRPNAPRSASTNTKINLQYLVLYNLVNAFLWLIVLGRVLLLVPLVGHEKVYGGVGQFAKWTQTLALLEIVHSLLGIVRAPLFTTGMQVASRLLLVWAVVNQYPEQTTVSPGYTTMLLAWSLTEVIRYSYFVGNLRGTVPRSLTWLRYNTFLLLYPIGISSEVWLISRVIRPANQERRFGFVWTLRAILLAYAPGSWVLYTYMLKQRKKVMRYLKTNHSRDRATSTDMINR